MAAPTPIGIDIGGSSIKVAASLATATSDRYRDPDADTVRNAIEQALDRAGVSRLGTVGLCLPGIVTDHVVEMAANLPRLTNVDVRTLVPRATRWHIETDVRAAAHHVWHERRMAGRLLAIAIGTGVGACVLDDGRPLRITGASSGHLGHIDIGGTPLESVIGAEALRRAGLDTLAAPQLTALASAIRTAHAIYRPHHIVLLGGIGMKIDVDTLRAHIGAAPLAREPWTLTTGWTTYHAAHGVSRLATPEVSSPPDD